MIDLLVREPLAVRLQHRLRVEREAERSGRSFRRNPERSRLERRFIKPTLKAALLATGLYAKGKRNALEPVVRELSIAYRHLPAAFHGYRMLHLSDLHIDSLEQLPGVLAARLKGLKADVCLMTGDYRFDVEGSCEPARKGMREVLASISCPVIATLGNHDACEMGPALEDMGVDVLVNEAIQLQREGKSIWVAGTDDSYDYRCDDLDAALANVPANAFKILMAHTPDLYQDAAAQGVDLYLCGHTHGGQIRLPWVGAVISNSDAPRAYTRGRWRHGSMEGFTSSGIGCSMLPVRFNCPPEIALVELRQA